MSSSEQLSEALAIVETERQGVRDCKRAVDECEAQLIELKSKLSQRQASLAVAERMFALFENGESVADAAEEESPKRRMRLGAKKRAVYALVSKQVSTLEQLETHLTRLHNTDIDRRYIRDVVRDAIAQGDMQGDIEREFIFTDLGREILEKAPIPAGWERYEAAAAMRLPSAAVGSGAKFYGGGEVSAAGLESLPATTLRDLGEKLA